MRLLHCLTHRIEEFHGDNIPPYAILSHTWEDDEASFQDMQMSPVSGIASKKGLSKIMKACVQACSDNLLYIWIDTCCIDKTSSSELSEAINSMFR